MRKNIQNYILWKWLLFFGSIFWIALCITDKFHLSKLREFQNLEVFEDVPDLQLVSETEEILTEDFKSIFNVGSLILLLLFFGSIKVTTDIRKKVSKYKILVNDSAITITRNGPQNQLQDYYYREPNKYVPKASRTPTEIPALKSLKTEKNLKIKKTDGNYNIKISDDLEKGDSLDIEEIKKDLNEIIHYTKKKQLSKIPIECSKQITADGKRLSKIPVDCCKRKSRTKVKQTKDLDKVTTQNLIFDDLKKEIAEANLVHSSQIGEFISLNNQNDDELTPESDEDLILRSNSSSSTQSIDISLLNDTDLKKISSENSDLKQNSVYDFPRDRTPESTSKLCPRSLPDPRYNVKFLQEKLDYLREELSGIKQKRAGMISSSPAFKQWLNELKH